MKRKIAITVAVIVLILAIATVGVVLALENKDNTNTDPQQPGETQNYTINIVVPDGSPAIALAKMINDNDAPKGYTVNYTIVNGAQEIATRIANGSADIAIAPTNILSTIYNNTKSGKLVGTVVQGALYMVGKNAPAGETTLEKLNSLKGKVVYNIGQGATPDLTFKYIMDAYEIEYANTAEPTENQIGLQYVQTGAELIPLLKQNKAEYGILGEPAVSNANQNAGTSTVFDIQALWQEVTGSQSYGFPQAGLYVVNKYLTADHAALVNWIAAKLDQNSEWAEQNPAKVSEIMTANGSMSLSGLTTGKIAGCNLDWISAADAKTGVNTYLAALYGFNPQTVGGKVPDDGFYYVG